MTAKLPLDGLKVVELTDLRADLCARLLADLGADVIKVEPPGGVAARRAVPAAGDGNSLAFAVRNANKRSVELDLASPDGRAAFHAMLASADVLVVGLPSPGADIDPEVLSRTHPRLVVTAISDFGQSGPYRDFVATEDVMVAISGMLARSGVVGRPPLLPPGRLASDITAVSATFFTLAALWQRDVSHAGQHLDVSVMQALAQVTDWSMANCSFVTNQGGQYAEMRRGSMPVYPLYPCADGHVRLVILSPRQWRAMRAWLGEPDFLQDDHWDSIVSRMTIQADLLDPLFVELFKDRAAVDLAEEAQRRGVVMTPVLRPAEVLAADHFVGRATFVEAPVAPGITAPVPSGFFEFDGVRVGYRSPCPSIGEHTDAVLESLDGAQDRSGTGTDTPDAVVERPASLPFAGLHVLDLGHGGVGVETGKLFAEYGADVVKVETATYPDFIRQVSGGMMSPSFASSNRSKRSIGLNVKRDGGLDVLKRLVGWADVLIENTSTGTLADMGISYEVLHEINPRIVVASSQLMGSRGSWSDWIGYGPSTRPAAGMTYLWNFEDGASPPGTASIHPDHLVGRVLAVGALAQLLGRRNSDVGAHVEVAQVEAVVNVLGEYFAAECLSPGSVQPAGNRRPAGAPWGVYPCAGDERWCVITVRDDDDWTRLRVALGDPEWTRRPDLATLDGRRNAHDEIDDLLAAWTSRYSDREVMTILQAAGVPAAAVAYPSDLLRDEHLAERGYHAAIVQPPLGDLVLEGRAVASSAMAGPIAGPAPLLAEHTREVCIDILGMTESELAALVAEGALELADEVESRSAEGARAPTT